MKDIIEQLRDVLRTQLLSKNTEETLLEAIREIKELRNRLRNDTQ